MPKRRQARRRGGGEGRCSAACSGGAYAAARARRRSAARMRGEGSAVRKMREVGRQEGRRGGSARAARRVRVCVSLHCFLFGGLAYT